MKQKKRNTLYLVLLSFMPLFLMAGGLFFCVRSTGFSIDKISSNLSYNEVWETPPLTQREQEHLLQEVLSQTYYYLASGNQCYAFISEDRQYVLKFFKMQNLFPKSWIKGLPLSLLQRLRFVNEEDNLLFSERIFASYKDAYESLSEQTGLLYIHFNKTRDLKSKVTLIDNKGKKYLLDLDRVEFVVQRRAQKIFEYLGDLHRGQKYDELKTAISSFLKLIAIRCEKGFADQDLKIRNNFGYIGNNAVQIDCATLTRDSSMKYPLNFREEVMHVTEHLNIWARDYCPELTLYIQEEAQRIINNSF